MNTVKLGHLYSLKNHPYDADIIDVQIAGYAAMSPPILVISEILNSPTEYDSDSGEVKPKQVRAIYYSHKSHKFENYWFDIKQLKSLIANQCVETDLHNNGEINTLVDKASILEYNKETSILEIKKKFVGNQVILKSCDYELGKKKISESINNSKKSKTINSHLDFLPPVLTVIDVKKNEEKNNYNPKTGNLRKISSVFILKCKWYNPMSGGFSEDFIPIDTIQIIEPTNILSSISHLINNKTFIKQNSSNALVLESSEVLNHTYIQILSISFNHYKYIIEYFDFFRQKKSYIDLSTIIIGSNHISLDDLILTSIPKYDDQSKKILNVEDFVFTPGNYYRITYKDMHERITKRIIYVKLFVKKTIVVADCLLRDGSERHFRIKDAILRIEKLNQNYFKMGKK